MSIFTGAGVAIVTPMNEDGSVNFDSFRNLVEEQIAGGTDCIIVCGTTVRLLHLVMRSIWNVLSLL